MDDPDANERKFRQPGTSRRNLLKAIPAAMVAPAAWSAANDPRNRSSDSLLQGKSSQTDEIGNFVVTTNAKRIGVRHRAEPSRVLWETSLDIPFLCAARGEAIFFEHGDPLGSFEVVNQSLTEWVISGIEGARTVDAHTLIVHGTLTGHSSG